MALSLGQLVGGAGIVATRQRQAEEAERVARQNQLLIEEQNRLERLRQMPRPDIGEVPATTNFEQYRMDVREITPEIVPEVTPTQVAPLATAKVPAGLMLGTVGAQEALKKIPTMSLTREQFQSLSPEEKQRRLTEVNTPKRVRTAGAERFDFTPGKQMTMEQLEASLKQTAGTSETRRRGRATTKGKPQNFDKIAAAVMQVESRGDPNAVSPKGALGTMQVMPGTLEKPGYGVTPAQDRSPQELERVGKDYLAAMIREFKGNLDHALVAYNWGPREAKQWISRGANVAELPAETRNYIQKVKSLIGGAVETIIPTAKAETPAAGVRQTTRPSVQASSFYMGNPQAVSRDMQVALQNREELRRMAMMYRDAGLTQQYDTLRQQVMELDNNLFYLSGMQGIQQLMSYRDPRMLSAVISQATGTQTGIRPRTDNTYDIVANPGTDNEGIIAQGVVAEQLAAYAQELFDPSIRAARTELAQFAAKEEIKGRAGLQSAVVKAEADIRTAIINGEYKIAEQLAKDAKGELKFDTASGKWAFIKGNDVRIIDPSETQVIETPLGPISRPPTARRIGGLTFGQ